MKVVLDTIPLFGSLSLVSLCRFLKSNYVIHLWSRTLAKCVKSMTPEALQRFQQEFVVIKKVTIIPFLSFIHKSYFTFFMSKINEINFFAILNFFSVFFLSEFHLYKYPELIKFKWIYIQTILLKSIKLYWIFVSCLSGTPKDVFTIISLLSTYIE